MVDVPLPAHAAAAAVLPGRFGALQRPAYRILWSSGLVMFFAIQAQMIARSWLAIEITGTNTGLGGVYLAFGLPMLLVSPVGGVLADRFAKRTVLRWCQGALLGGALAVSVAVELHALQYWMLLVTAAVHGAGMAVMGPTRMAYTGEVVDRPLLANAVVLQQMGANSTRIIGPAIVGALIGIETIGAGGVYIMTSALIFAAIVISRFLPKAPPRTGARPQSPTKELADGIRYLRSQKHVLFLVVVSTVVSMVGFAYMAFLPSLARQVFDVGSSGYGFMSMASAIGALGTTFWIAGRVSDASIWRLQATCGLTLGVAIVSLGLSPGYLVALVVLVILGGAQSGFQVTNSSLILTETPLAYHGRMQALMMIGFAGSGIVALPLGAVADAIGLRQTLVAMGLIIAAAMACYALARRRHLATQAALASSRYLVRINPPPGAAPTDDE